MPFPRKLLNEGEEVLLDLHPHWAYFTKPALGLLGGIVVGIVALVRTRDNTVPRTVLGVLALALIVIGALWLLARWLKWLTTNIVVTSDRLISRTGVLSKAGMEIPIDRVMNVSSNQTVWERMIGSGDLLIESGGEEGQERFSNIRRPAKVQNLILSRTRQHVKDSGASSVGTDAATQLEKLATLLEKGHITQVEFDAQKAKLLGA
jgi:uncharacterized membrane protein YdbT with pleckstrin-like domain